METRTIAPLAEYFKDVKDPRIERKKLYPLNEVIIITILAFMSMAEGWEDIEDYGKAKQDWLKNFLPLKNGIPKHDVYRLVFARLKPEELEACFMRWIHAIQDLRLPIDGKTIRGSADRFACLKAATTHEVDHGRTELRDHAVTGDAARLIARHPLWKSIKSIAVIEEMRGCNGERGLPDKSALCHKNPQVQQAPRFKAGFPGP
jgi:hypothetical protein